jgi:lipocalin
MNKFFTAVIVLLALSAVQAQNPKPFPAFNLTAIEGNWYLIFTYSQGGTNNSEGYDCWQMNFKAHDKTQTLIQNITYEGQPDVSTFSATPQSNQAVWKFSTGQELVFMNVDPVSNSFALLGYEGMQIAFFLSRTPSQSEAVIEAQIAFAKAEGYLMTNSETLVMNNECN